MPCHDILVQTGILEADQSSLERAAQFWEAQVSAMGLLVPAGFRASLTQRASYDDTASQRLDLLGLYSIPAADQQVIKQRYEQAYVGAQIFAALQADGYEMTSFWSPEHEGTWVIEARDNSRNATIGVTLYRTLDFEIDFLDALHDDSVWLSGGEFGRVLEFMRRLGLSTEVVKQEVDEDTRRALSNQLYA